MVDRNAKLRKVYEEAFPSLIQASTMQSGVSGPLLIDLPPAYEEAKVKLLCVGQQTNGWFEIDRGIDGLLKGYREFDLGRNYTPSPFWQACHRLSRSLNPDGPGFSFAWSNLVRVDQDQMRPSRDIEEAVSTVKLLQKEIAVLEPHVVVFFTGPYYDARLRESFPGIRLTADSPWVTSLTHPLLPSACYRTYHPHYLWRARQPGIIDEIGRKAVSCLGAAS